MDNNQNQAQYSYYQNLYNMFGGHNPLIDTKVKKLRRTGFIIGCGMICFTIMQYVFAFLLQSFGLYSLYNSDPFYQLGISAIAPIFYVLLPFVLVYLLYTREEKNSVDIYELPKSKELFVFSVFTGLLICSFGDTATAYFSTFFNMMGVSFESPDTLNANSPVSYALQIVAYAIIPPLVEEFAMRGVVMQPLRKYGDSFAIIVSSILFAALHGNMVQIPFAFIAGLALGYFAIVTNSIWTSVAIHFLNNFTATVISIHYDKNPNDNMLFYYAIEGAILIVGIFAFIMFIKNKPSKLSKDTSEIGGSLKYSTLFCTPSIVVSLLISLLTSLSFTKIRTGGGTLLTIVLVALVAFFLIRGSLNARRDTRISRSAMYNVSIVLTVVASVFMIYFLMIMPLSNQ